MENKILKKKLKILKEKIMIDAYTRDVNLINEIDKIFGKVLSEKTKFTKN